METKTSTGRNRELKVAFGFFGTGDFARRLLIALLQSSLTPCLVVTSPPRPAGRGRKLQDPPIKKVAEEAGIPVLQPEEPHAPEVLKALSTLDFIVVSDYGRILRRPVLEAPTIAPLNLHPSLLPRWRGAAPVERAMMYGDTETGVTIFVMDEGVDTGPILLQEATPIRLEETRQELENRLIELAVPLLRKAMTGLKEGSLKPNPQLDRGKTYAKKLGKQELWVDWSWSAEKIVRHIHALSPRPGSRTYLDGQYVKLLRARLPENVREHPELPPGTIQRRRDRLLIATGKGWVEILEIQPEGKKPMPVSAYLQGRQPHHAQSPQDKAAHT